MTETATLSPLAIPSESKLSVSSTMSSVSSLQAVTDAPSQPHKPKGSQKGRKGHSSRIFYFWTCDEVVKWLRKHCGQLYHLYGDIFKQHNITGRTLVRITDVKLQKIGIMDQHHREDLMRHILKLRLKVEAQELKNLNHKTTCLTIEQSPK